MTPERSYLWIVGPDGTARVTLPPAGEIDRLVGEHQKTIANVLADPLAAADTAGDKLYRLLVAPASRWLTPGTPVSSFPRLAPRHQLRDAPRGRRAPSLLD